MKILIIGATHGNELLGTKLFSHILAHRRELLEHVEFIIGNPRAYAQGVRYTEGDLNRSYGTRKRTYEARRAREIVQHIKRGKYDLVIDMHTTTCVQDDVMITIAPDNLTVRRFLAACHVDKLLKVQPMHDIASVVENLIAFEISNSRVDVKLLERMCDDIQRFVDGTRAYKTKQLYEMTGKILKKDFPEGNIAKLKNFEMSGYGFVPIFVGENSYKQQTLYRGFKLTAPVVYEV